MKHIDIELIAYKDDFCTYPNGEKFGSHGWGCGYVHIPKGHPILIKIELQHEWSLFDLYKEGFSEEITYAEWVKDGEFYKIGFHTNESFHNEAYDMQWVLNRANELQAIVMNYTYEDAKKDIESHLERRKEILLESLGELNLI